MQRLVLITVAIASLLLLIPLEQALAIDIITTEDLYSCDNPNDGRNRINLLDESDGTIISSQTITVSGLATLDGCLGLAVDPTDGQMYAIIRDVDRFLVSIDPTTGVGTNIGEFTYADNGKAIFEPFFARSINFDSSGQLYVTESSTNGIPKNYYKFDKTTGLGDTSNLLCTFPDTASNINSFITLNYDTGDMFWIGQSDFFVPMDYGIIDETFAGGECVTPTASDLVIPRFQQGVAYDTVTEDYYFLDDHQFSHDFVRMTGSGVTTILGVEAHDGLQKGLAFTISIEEAPIPAIESNRLYTCDKRGGNDDGGYIHEIDLDSFGEIISSNEIVVDVDTNDSSYETGLWDTQGCLGLATDPTDGQMYAILKDDNSDRYLAQIDPTTGESIIVGSEYIGWDTPELYQANMISFDISGVLYVSDSNDGNTPTGFWSVDFSDSELPTTLECEFETATGEEFFYVALNYDTGDQYVLSGAGGDYEIGIVDTGDSSCQINVTSTDMGVGMVMDMAYNTVTGNFIYQAESEEPQNIEQLLGSTDFEEFEQIEGSMGDGDQRGMAYSLSLGATAPPDAPVILVSGDLIIDADQWNPASYVEYGASCIDPEDGVLPISSIDLSGIDFDVIGSYSVFYHCIDSDLNDFPAQRTVIILFAPRHIYTFDGNSNDSLGGSPFVLSDGGTGLNATGWNFQVGDFAQVSNAINENNYAIEMVFQFEDPTTFQEWNQILEFHNFQTSPANADDDAGLWKESSNSEYANYFMKCDSVSGKAIACDYQSDDGELEIDTLQHIIFQRNESTGLVEFWWNGDDIMEDYSGQHFDLDPLKEFHFSQPNQILTLFGTNDAGHGNPEWAGQGYLACVNIYDEPMSFDEAQTRTSFKTVQCSNQAPTAPAYPITDLSVGKESQFSAYFSWGEPLHEGELIEYQIQVNTPFGIPITNYVTTTDTFHFATELFFGTDYSIDVHAITDSSESLGRAGNIVDFTTLGVAQSVFNLVDKISCISTPFDGLWEEYPTFDYCGIKGDTFIGGGFEWNVDPNIRFDVKNIEVQDTANLNMNGDMVIRDSLLNDGTITNTGTMTVAPIFVDLIKPVINFEIDNIPNNGNSDIFDEYTGEEPISGFYNEFDETGGDVLFARNVQISDQFLEEQGIQYEYAIEFVMALTGVPTNPSLNEVKIMEFHEWSGGYVLEDSHAGLYVVNQNEFRYEGITYDNEYATASYNVGDLTHLLVSRDSNGLVTFYQDGVKIFDYDDSVTEELTFNGNTGVEFRDNDLKLFRDYTNDPPQANQDARIECIRFYSPLTDAEAIQITDDSDKCFADVIYDTDLATSTLDNNSLLTNNGIIIHANAHDNESIIDNSNSIVNNGQILSACLSTYLGSNPTVNARTIEACFGIIDSFPLDVAWDISTAVESDLPIPFQVGLYDSDDNLIGSFTGEITTTGAQNAEATFNQPIPADGLVSIGVGGNNIKWSGDGTPADFSSSTLPNPFIVDGSTNSSQRTMMTVSHPAQNTEQELNQVETFENSKNIALTVIGVLPVALFFALFSVLSGRVDGAE